MGPDGRTLRIGKSTPYAKELLRQHKRVYQKYWAWCDHILDTTLLFRKITTCFGWQMHIFGREKKEGRTIKNFPCQAKGAEILRVACIFLVENNIKLIAPIHDAIFIECDEEKADETILQAQKLMTKASAIVLGPGNSIKTEANVIKYPERYSDPRGVKTWNRVIRIIEEIKTEIYDA